MPGHVCKEGNRTSCIIIIIIIIIITLGINDPEGFWKKIK